MNERPTPGHEGKSHSRGKDILGPAPAKDSGKGETEFFEPIVQVGLGCPEAGRSMVRGHTVIGGDEQLDSGGLCDLNYVLLFIEYFEVEGGDDDLCAFHGRKEGGLILVVDD